MCFQLLETTWCTIGFHGSHSHMNDVTRDPYLGFSKFQIFSIIELNTENGEKTTVGDVNQQSCKIYSPVFNIYAKIATS